MKLPQGSRPLLAISAVLLALSACGGERVVGAEGRTPTVLYVSDVWERSTATAEADSRRRELRAAIEELRAGTSSGWVGRQDDVTGYLAELSGGRYFAPSSEPVELSAALFDDFGEPLFGITSAELAFSEVENLGETAALEVRGIQQVDGVPVLDGEVTVTIGDPDGQPRVNAVRGRVFAGIDVDTRPSVPAPAATRIARRLSGGIVPDGPTLIVVPGEEGRLAWQVAVVGAEDAGTGFTLSDGIYLIGAADGELIDVRPASAHSHAPAALGPKLARSRERTGGRVVATRAPKALGQVSEAVTVTGQDPTGQGTLQAVGAVTPDGRVALVDTTVPTYDEATGEGGIYTYDAGGSQREQDLPGQLYVENGTEISDPEALAGHALSRVVYDYYANLGRASWDGQGGSLISTVNFGGGNFCNSFFSGTLQPPQMVYGNPCQGAQGPAETSEVEIDTAGHEITHGVTDTSAGLIYSGQSGALNESFSDYFGNVIGNAMKDSDSAELFEGGCFGFTSPTEMCLPNPEGGLSLRYMLNGSTFKDYLYLLNPPHRLSLLGVEQDNGGVHLNSAIWNNALWSIRARLAQIDGTSGNDSQLAGDFDKIVYAALTRKLGPSSGFLDARRAVEDTIVEAGADEVIARVAGETFDLNAICQGCADPEPGPGVIVTSAPQTQVAPTVSGDRIAWLDMREGDGIFGFPANAAVGQDPANLSTTPETAQVAFAGDSLIALQLPGSIVRYDGGAAETLDPNIEISTLVAGLGGSSEGAAWVSMERGEVYFIDPAGEITTAGLPRLGNESVVSIATGGGTVAMGTDGGSVMSWTPGQEVAFAGTAEGSVLAIGTHGSRIIAVDDLNLAWIYDTTSGASTVVSEDAIPFGAAMNENYAVWANSTGTLGGEVARTNDVVFPDTDLYMFSFDTNTIYNLLPQRGQQGFPAMSGNRIAWQDSVFGGDDILTATIPPGL